MSMEPLAVSVPQAAKAVGLGLTTTWNLIGSGRLDVVRLGRRTLVKTSSIRKLIEGGEA